MPRPLRICMPNLTYHVYSRCRQLEPLMNDSIKDIVVRVLYKSQQKYNYDLINYTVLDNHFHFIIKTLDNEAQISQIMQYIKSRIAQEYNKKYKIKGPFWNERFCDTIIEKSEDPEKYLLWLLWYLAFNPVRKKAVADPRKYKYSSIMAYLSNEYKSILKITLHEIYFKLGRNLSERLEIFLQYEEAYQKRIAVLF